MTWGGGPVRLAAAAKNGFSTRHGISSTNGVVVRLCGVSS
jgi:hypothetical protein